MDCWGEIERKRRKISSQWQRRKKRKLFGEEEEKKMERRRPNGQTNRISSCILDPFCRRGRVEM